MRGLVAAVSNKVPTCCRSNSCKKDGCSLSVPSSIKSVLVDLDCDMLQIPPDQKRCDYVFVGEKNTKAWVALVELKSGKVRASDVVAQLQGGAKTAEAWLPNSGSFQFVPVLAHGKGISPIERETLREKNHPPWREETNQIDSLQPEAERRF